MNNSRITRNVFITNFDSQILLPLVQVLVHCGTRSVFCLHVMYMTCFLLSPQVCMKLLEMMNSDTEYQSTLLKKLAPPLVTLLSAEPEIQYVALRNINLIVQKRYLQLHHRFMVSLVKYLASNCCLYFDSN